MTHADYELFERDETAADWAVRRREGLSPTEQAELDVWLAESPANRRAFERSDAVWTDWKALDLKALAKPGAVIVPLAPKPTRAIPRLPAWATIAASLAVVAVTAGVLLANAGQVIATERGEVRTVALADGSRVTLGAGSKIAVRFDASGRHVQLRRGEALFDVRHDAARPFDVRAEDTRVTVLGTQFMVKAAPDRVRVDVVEGVVRVNKDDGLIAQALAAHPALPQELIRGERIESPKGARLAKVETVDPAKIAAWTKGRLVYADAPLGEVVSDLNRYAGSRIELESRDLDGLRVTAALRQDQVPGFLQSLPSTLPVTLEQRGDVTMIRQAAAAGG